MLLGALTTVQLGGVHSVATQLTRHPVLHSSAITELLQRTPTAPQFQVPPTRHTQAALHCPQEEISRLKATHSSGNNYYYQTCTCVSSWINP